MLKSLFISSLLLIILTLTGVGQNGPVSSADEVISETDTAIVNLRATGIAEIASCSLRLLYDPEIASFVTLYSGESFSGGLAFNNSVPGVIVIGWYTWPGVTIPDTPVIFRLVFSRVKYGTSEISWDDDGYSCYFSNDSSVVLNDVPFSEYYRNGSLTFKNVNGIPEAENGQFSIYPNPCHGSIIMKTTGVNENLLVTGFSSLGKTLFQKNIRTENGIANISGLQEGLIFLKVKSENGRESVLKIYSVDNCN